jgi:alginate O-acetyltransferase complex protein AlgI
MPSPARCTWFSCSTQQPSTTWPCWARTRWKRLWLAVSIVNDLSLLGYFKYSGFLAESLNWLLARLGLPYAVDFSALFKYASFLADELSGWLAQLGVPYAIPDPGVLLPVGLSFYLFQSLTYTIDFSRGRVAREPSFLHYAAFVSLFPQLLMGPIERARNLLPQLHETATVTWQDVADGLSLFVVGLFKKVALADYLALYVAKVFDAPDEFQSPALVLASVAFAWQIYFDFSGYTDMARGVARLLGIRLMLNFNNPYLATGLGDFWHRWHISLSTWFRDYVYIPLGGNRKGEFATYRNMALTMVISGLWHGAQWTFVMWGALHALYRVLTRSLESSRFYAERVPRFVKILFVFCLVTFAWIFFRARTFEDAWTIVTRIFVSGWADPGCPLLMLALIASVWLYQILHEARLSWILRPAPVRLGIMVLMVIYMVIVYPSQVEKFIYAQF